MIRIRTPSRLHFGLIAPAAKAGRRFGGVGMMIDQPGVQIRLEPSRDWLVRGPLAERGQAVVNRLLSTYLGTQAPPHAIRIEHAAPEHMGLGTGTQLSLAIARGLAETAGIEDKSASQLAPLVDRGQRSAIGTHGFDRGGFLVDGGKTDSDDVAPLVAWLSFPEDWRIVLILPPWQPGVHGLAERYAFGQLREIPGRAEALSRQVLLELLPALSVGDFAGFSESLHQFNRAAGEAFAAVQGGPYASARIATLIDTLRESGVRGVGQSSWGPTVFVVTDAVDRTTRTVARVLAELGLAGAGVVVTEANNGGVELGG
jgi:beta-RFAP synthase